MKKFHRGFTIVEVATVIAIVAVLATLTLVMYGNVQKQARDTKRKNDIEMMVAQLEKYYDNHGEYPTGCTTYDSASKTQCSYNSAKITQNSDAIYSDSVANGTGGFRAFLPGIPASFSDPKKINDQPFNFVDNKGNAFFYIGELEFIPADASSTGTGSGFGVPLVNSSGGYSFNSSCGGSTIWMTLGKSYDQGSRSSFILGYMSEVDGKWHIYQGKYGAELSSNASGKAPIRGLVTEKCVFEK